MLSTTLAHISGGSRREGAALSNEESKEKLRRLVLARVLDGVWHTTNGARFKQILNSGAILPEPNIPDSERWGTAKGPQGYPYVRSLGGVSLCDFNGFDHTEYSNKYPASSWAELVPYRSVWREAVWIEIKTETLGKQFVSGPDLLTRWKKDGNGKKILPLIEAGHIGPIPLTAFKTAFAVSEGNSVLGQIEY